MTAFPSPVAAGSPDPAAPLVVLLHGRGGNERDIIGLAQHLPVIPRELLDRTWDHLHGDSRAETTALHHPGGHGVTPDALAVVSGWLDRTLTHGPARQDRAWTSGSTAGSLSSPQRPRASAAPPRLPRPGCTPPTG